MDENTEIKTRGRDAEDGPKNIKIRMRTRKVTLENGKRRPADDGRSESTYDKVVKRRGRVRVE